MGEVVVPRVFCGSPPTAGAGFPPTRLVRGDLMGAFWGVGVLAFLLRGEVGLVDVPEGWGVRGRTLSCVQIRAGAVPDVGSFHFVSPL